eukprot:CAMPEP_0113584718 /NCGR_PEP_ID=MMETSP0015_2-20120614/33263_1 /TAXON_ID=2838 /ORGANISM="Odontella" /LENGTH=63 /DNA_ID=CAMNT_0000489807 /DNA_START=111 /DNA_END=298 /DNA_ORIENTATION=- /assembly_acc=CAM_ASM_000160
MAPTPFSSHSPHVVCRSLRFGIIVDYYNTHERREAPTRNGHFQEDVAHLLLEIGEILHKTTGS